MIINSPHNRVSKLKLCIALALGLSCISSPSAWAQDLTLALPEQSLATSINEIARQGQIQVIYDNNALKSLRAPAISGKYASQTALQKLLIGSGLELVAQGEGFVIRPQQHADSAIMIAETSVQGVSEYNPATDVISAPQYITSEEISQRSTGDGNVTELLRTNPAVQFAGNDSSSLNQGEIKPARISIHGASSFQNAYKLDGVSFNNDFDPAKNDLGETATRVDTGDQGMYIDSRLIDSVTVYDNNIPVEFGGFTGGSVDVTSRRWSGENSAHAYYRTTRSSWNHLFHDSSQPIDSSKNDTSNPARFQNKYTKQDFGGWFETNITDNSGMILSVSRRTSDIPIDTHFTKIAEIDNGVLRAGDDQARSKKSQKRTSDNIFLKYSIDLSPVTTLDLSTNYSDYESRLFSSTVYNSGYDNHHKGINFTGILKHQADLANLELTTSYQRLSDNRVNDTDYFVDLLVIEQDDDFNTNMTKYRGGGMGDLKTQQDNTAMKGVARFNATEWLGMKHSPTAGFEVNHTKGKYIRDDDFYRYSFYQMKMPGQPDMNNISDITRFQSGSYGADYTNYALFLDDNIIYGRLTLRPGIRLDRDDFVQKTNISPRITASYDLFDDQSTLLIGGLNRYYGRSMLTYALYGAQNAGMQNCTYGCSMDPSKNDWENRTDFEGLDSLKTPYSDELTLALQQEVLSTTWRLQYVHRKGYDEVRSRTKYKSDELSEDFEEKNRQARIKTFDNEGRSKHDSVTLSVRNSQPWEWANASHVVTSSLVWQQTKNNTPNDQGYSSFDPSNRVNSDKVWYDGRIIDASNLPATNFNSPLKFNVEVTSEWDDYGVTWYNRLQWWGARNQAVRFDDDYEFDKEYGQLRKYTKIHFASKYTWDTRVSWKPDFTYGVNFSVEVNNVLNNKNVADVFMFEDEKVRSYDPGRQFWLQVNYDF